MNEGSNASRSIGLLGATGIGVGAIVGGGILALAGVAFAATGPGALAAFALNGLIALLTALSFAEMAAAFPESGGTYTFAKKVLTGEAAFMVGWIVWLASIVAAVLYALGFASYAGYALSQLGRATLGIELPWVEGHSGLLVLATLATVGYGVSLLRKATGGGQWATVGKVIVFFLLIAGGLWVAADRPASALASAMRPFFPGGAAGLFQAMGYTFIALQGFDLIAAVGGEIRDARRTIPRAMLLSLGIALGIYLPLLFVIATVGVTPGGSIQAMSVEDPATVVAVAAGNFLGPFGFWLVIVAAILSMLSALHANLLAASRVARTMAQDRTLPVAIEALHRSRGTPVPAILATVTLVIVILLLVGDVAGAGAVSSLIFLLSFALAHGTNILAQRRGGVADVPFRVPWFPLVPVAGGLACLALAAYQAVAVPSAGWVAGIWLGLGSVLYFFLFARRARVVDASAEGLDPDLVRLRGRAPLVIVPIAKPLSVPGLVQVATALAPPRTGRILLLSIVQPPGMWQRGDLAQQLMDVGAILERSFTLSLAAGTTPEWLTTVAPDPWPEIGRVARLRDCESLLVGLGKLTEEGTQARLEGLIRTVRADVIILRAPEGWRLSEARRVLAPVGGLRHQSKLRARLLGTLCRDVGREITYLRVLPESAPEAALERARLGLQRLVHDEVRGQAAVLLNRSADVLAEIARHAAESDLVVVGLQRRGSRRKAVGELTLGLARATACPLILISAR